MSFTIQRTIRGTTARRDAVLGERFFEARHVLLRVETLGAYGWAWDGKPKMTYRLYFRAMTEAPDADGKEREYCLVLNGFTELDETTGDPVALEHRLWQVRRFDQEGRHQLQNWKEREQNVRRMYGHHAALCASFGLGARGLAGVGRTLSHAEERRTLKASLRSAYESLREARAKVADIEATIAGIIGLEPQRPG